jgi:hypothetical protein
MGLRSGNGQYRVTYTKNSLLQEEPLQAKVHSMIEGQAMSANTAKQEAINAIQHLPDTANMGEIMYRLYVLESIRKGAT